MSGREVVPTLLEEYGDRTRVALRAHLRPREPQRHLYGLVADYPERPGRMLRPSLCIATARAFGADPDEALHTAVALELLHNGFLVHDDIEDESEERRGAPTLHALHGTAVAINVGDALVLLGMRALLDNRERLGDRLSLRVLEEAERMARETVEGQAIELGWRRDNAMHLDVADYLQMILKKTCWYTVIFPLRAGALIGTRDRFELDRLFRFGFFLGAAFQIQDDLLNLVGDPLRYGKEICGDLREAKRTLMLIRLTQRASQAELERLAELLALGRDQRGAEETAWIRERIERYDCLDFARDVAHALAGAASHECEKLFASLPDSRDKRFIEALPEWVLLRS